MAFNHALKDFRRSTTVNFASAVGAVLGRDKRACRSLVRQLFLDHLDPSCRVFVEFDTHLFVVDPRDTQVGFKLMSGQDWQRRELASALEILRAAGRLDAGKAFIDVGANIGTQTVYAYLDGAFSRSIAIEAEAANFALLQRNIALNGLSGRAQAYHLAASDAVGTLHLAIDRMNAGGHAITAGPTPEGALEIAAMPVDAVVSRAGLTASDVGLVWIDVEGHELRVLAGMTDLLAAGVPIVIEFDGKNHGPQAANLLRTALGSRYTMLAVLDSKGTSQSRLPMPIEAFIAPASARDLLIY